MSDIPSEVFRKILVQLPAVSFRFRSVCKAWLGMIDDPSFIKDHANNQVYSHTLLVRSETGAPLFSFSLDSLHFVKDLQEIDGTKIKQFIRRDVSRLQPLFDVASCNGLLLLSHEDIKKIWAIWNPLTGDCHLLPQPNAAVRFDCFGFGFGLGYDGDADVYKAVRVDKVISAGKVVFQTLVYNLKLESWGLIEDCPGEIALFGPGVFLNGTLYWRSWNMIIALDIRTERYRRLPLPPIIFTAENRIDGYRLDALDGCLIFSSNYYDRPLLDAWVMKDNGAEKSWIKLFSLKLSLSHSMFETPRAFKLVAYLKGKQQVLVQNSRGFSWFDIGTNSVLDFSVHCFSRIASSKICPGSLVRLKPRGSAIESEVTARRTTTKKRKRNIEETYASLKICVRNDGDMCCSLDGYCREGFCDCSLAKREWLWD